MKKLIKLIRRHILTPKQYIVLTAIMLLITFLQTVSPDWQRDNFYTYEFGFISPWIYCYNSLDLGVKTLFQCLMDKNSLGFIVSPWNLIMSIALINIIIAFYKWITTPE